MKSAIPALVLVAFACGPAPDHPAAEPPTPTATATATATAEAPEPLPAIPPVDKVRGRVPPEAIQRVVRAHFGAYRACYEAGLARNPELTGRMTLRFVIGTDGKVSDAREQGDVPDGGFPDQEVTACVLAEVGKLTFPAPAGVIAVSYPIRFSPGDSPPPAVQEGGRLEPALIQKRVRESFASFRACYEEGLRRRGAKLPELEGKVTVKFVIGIDGKVTSATGSGDLIDKEVERCVATEMQKLVFPKPRGGSVTVSYPLVFSPN